MQLKRRRREKDSGNFRGQTLTISEAENKVFSMAREDAYKPHRLLKPYYGKGSYLTKLSGRMRQVGTRA